MLVLLQAHSPIKARVMDSGCDVDRYLRRTNVEPNTLKQGDQDRQVPLAAPNR